MTTILLIDDDEKLTEPMQYQLTRQGFKVLVANDGRTGLGLAMVEKPDVIVLDIMLPGMDGWQVCQEIRRFSQVPIIMLTALGAELDRVRGLELGADDYLNKPFSFQELVARIRAMMRRVQWDQTGTGQSEIRIGDVRLEPASRRAFKGATELVLRPKEYDLLFSLMQQAGKVVERETLFNHVWLRQKIEDDPSDPHYIQTIRGVGYRFATFEDMRA
jgi:DNA-binding response OmpR family regulator